MPFDLQPTLTGDLLELRPMCAEDFSALFKCASDPLIWEQHPNRDRYTEPAFRAFFDSGIESGGAFIARDLATGDVIGSSRYHGYDQVANEIEIGWTFLVRSHWGGRFNAEMKQIMIQHAFQFVGSVVFLIAPANVRSAKAVQKIGGVLDGARTNALGIKSDVYRIRQ